MISPDLVAELSRGRSFALHAPLAASPPCSVTVLDLNVPPDF
jgi:hypothetical protein